MTRAVHAAHRALLPATRNKAEPLSSRRSSCRNPQESMPSADPEQRDPPATSRLAPRRSTPHGRTSTRELQDSAPLSVPSQRIEIPARFPWPPPHARTPEGRTTDAREKRLPVLRSCRRYVVDLFNRWHPHRAIGQHRPCAVDVPIVKHATRTSSGGPVPWRPASRLSSGRITLRTKYDAH
jgi:hypothetical protein